MSLSPVHWLTGQALLAAAAALAPAGPAGATILTFDWTRDEATGSVVPTASPSFLPGDYGDHVSGPSVAVTGGSFLYGQGGEGYTPNVSIDVAGGGATAADAHVRLWAWGFGDLENVVFGLPASQQYMVRLGADPGFEAALYGFDLAGYPGRDWVIASVQVFAGPSLLFSQSNVLVEGAGPGDAHTAFDFASPLVGGELLILIDYSNLAPSQQDNIGLDNLRFAQWPPSAVPEPGSAGMLSTGLLLGWMRWRSARGSLRLSSCGASSNDVSGQVATEHVGRIMNASGSSVHGALRGDFGSRGSSCAGKGCFVRCEPGAGLPVRTACLLPRRSQRGRGDLHRRRGAAAPRADRDPPAARCHGISAGGDLVARRGRGASQPAQKLERMNWQGPLRGQIDLERIAVGGHSAGTGGALTVGGAPRNFTGGPIDLSDPLRRANAFTALSPQQQGNEGFFDTDHSRPTHSWIRLHRPVLLASGDGDSTCQPLAERGSCFGDTPWGRRVGFERMPAGDKYLMYLKDARVFHGLFALETGDDECIVSPDAQRRCDAVAEELRAAAVAFLDGHLMARPLAQQWHAKPERGDRDEGERAMPSPVARHASAAASLECLCTPGAQLPGPGMAPP